MNITNEEIKSHLNYPKPSDVTSMNIKSEEIDSQFHWRQFHNCAFRVYSTGGSTGNLWISIVESWFRILQENGKSKKKISILETPTSDFVISLLNRFLDKPRKDTVCSREQCLTVVFCGPFSANYARACKTAFLVRKVFQILSQISTHKIKTKCK